MSCLLLLFIWSEMAVQTKWHYRPIKAAHAYLESHGRDWIEQYLEDTQLKNEKAFSPSLMTLKFTQWSRNTTSKAISHNVVRGKKKKEKAMHVILEQVPCKCPFFTPGCLGQADGFNYCLPCMALRQVHKQHTQGWWWASAQARVGVWLSQLL